MILSKEFYNRCCPSYKKAIEELEKELAKNYLDEESYISTSVIRRKVKRVIEVTMKFSKKYLTPKEYWSNCLKYLGYLQSIITENMEKICYDAAAQSLFHLHFDEKWNSVELKDYDNEYLSESYNDKYFKLMDYQRKHIVGNDMSDFIGERDLSFPHSYLKRTFRCYERNASRLPSLKLIKRYEEMQELYSKIEAAKDDVDKWFTLLLEVNDIDFVKDNVELRLGNDYFNIHLWKRYIDFLKEQKDYKSLLETYSKYCRFFLDDHEMLEQYKEATIKYGPVKLQWDNLFDFEVNEFMEVSEEKESLAVKMKEVLPLDKKLCSAFYDTYKVQDFALSGPLILYLLKNASHRVLRKLCSSCKYLFAKKSTPICYSLKTNYSRTMFNNENLSLTYSANQNLVVKNTYITGRISVKTFLGLKDNANFISSLIPRLFCCEAKYIKLDEQNLSFNELKFLIQHGGVVELNMYSCRLLDENDEYVDLEKIMAFLPNIESLALTKIKTTANTGHALAKQDFYQKISLIYITKIMGEPFDPNEFLKFCIANKDEDFCLHLTFNKEFSTTFVKNFKHVFGEKKMSCGIDVDDDDQFYVGFD